MYPNNKILETTIDMLESGHEPTDEELASLMQGGDAVDALQSGTLLRESVIRDGVQQSLDIDAEWAKFASQNIETSEPRKLEASASRKLENSKIRNLFLTKMVAGLAASVLVLFGLYTWYNTTHPEPYVALKKQPVLTDQPTITSVSTKRSVALQTDRDTTQNSISFNNVLSSLGSSASANESYTITMPPGKSYSVTLADGTQVWLYANSSLTYPLNFQGSERHVYLKGEAYFKVAHDADHPFIVHAQQMDAKVLGTEINVSSYSDRPQHIALINGIVVVTGHQGGSVKLNPGQGATVNGSAISVTTENMEIYTYWRNGYIYLDDASLDDIACTIGHWYNVGVVFDNPVLRNMTMRFFCVRDEGLERAIELLNHFDEVHATLEDNEIHIR